MILDFMNPHKISAHSENKQKSYGMLQMKNLIFWIVTRVSARDYTVYETHNYFASVFNNGRMVDGGDLPIDFRTNAIIGPNVQFLNKGKETYWHFLTSS